MKGTNNINKVDYKLSIIFILGVSIKKPTLGHLYSIPNPGSSAGVHVTWKDPPHTTKPALLSRLLPAFASSFHHHQQHLSPQNKVSYPPPGVSVNGSLKRWIRLCLQPIDQSLNCSILLQSRRLQLPKATYVTNSICQRILANQFTSTNRSR